MKPVSIPVVAHVGPGSQPVDDDGAALDIMSMPDAMSTYAMPCLPEPEEVLGLGPALRALEEVFSLLARDPQEGGGSVDVSDLDEVNRRLVDQTLGEGEVSIVFTDQSLRIQESVLAGVWRVQERNTAGGVRRDVVTVATMPKVVTDRAFAEARSALQFDPDALPEGLQNAPSLVAEINEAMARRQDADRPYVINLSLLPHTPEDLLWLGEILGQGPVTLLSRGYGNCRIVGTGTRDVWWVQYFNSQDMLILNTLEITKVPEVACAAREDLEDSRERLGEILAVLT